MEHACRVTYLRVIKTELFRVDAVYIIAMVIIGEGWVLMGDLPDVGKAYDEQQTAFIARLRFNLAKCKAHIADSKQPAYGAGNLPGFSNTLNDDIVATVLQDVLSKSINLENGGSLHVKLDKNRPLSRAYTIARDESGEYHLFLEPKSKMSSGIKRFIEYASGSTKTRKVAVKIDSAEPKRYASLISKFDLSTQTGPAEKEAADREIDIQNTLHKMCSEVLPAIRGSQEDIVVNGQVTGKKICVFTELKDYTLSALVGDRISEVVKGSNDELAELKIDLIRQMINIIEKLHAAGYTVNDIKTDNFLYDPEEKKLYLIDLGFAAKLKQNDGSPTLQSAKGTPRFMAPWVFLNLLNRQFEMKNYPEAKALINQRLEEDMAKQLLDSPAFKFLEAARVTGSDRMQRSYANVINDGKSDVWALDMTIYDLLRGDNEETKHILQNWKSSNFFSSVFKVYQKDAPNIKKLSQLFEGNIGEIKAIALNVFTEKHEVKNDLSSAVVEQRLSSSNLSNLREFFIDKGNYNSQLNKIEEFRPKEFPDTLTLPELPKNLTEIFTGKDSKAIAALAKKLENQNLIIHTWLDAAYAQDKVDGSHAAAAANEDCQRCILANSSLIYLCNKVLAESESPTISSKLSGSALNFAGAKKETSLLDNPLVKMNNIQTEIASILPEISAGSFTSLYGSRYKPKA